MPQGLLSARLAQLARVADAQLGLPFFHRRRAAPGRFPDPFSNQLLLRRCPLVPARHPLAGPTIRVSLHVLGAPQQVAQGASVPPVSCDWPVSLAKLPPHPPPHPAAPASTHHIPEVSTHPSCTSSAAAPPSAMCLNTPWAHLLAPLCRFPSPLYPQVYPAEQLLVIPSEKMKAPQDMKDSMMRFANFIGLPDSGERRCRTALLVPHSPG
jgi:hypothetical protein